VRQIAKAAGVHPSRISQLVAQADEISEAAKLQPLRRKKRPK
jgi:hypothetical protein